MPPRVGRVLATAEHRVPPIFIKQLDDVVAASLYQRWQARDGGDHEGEGDEYGRDEDDARRLKKS